MGLHSRFMLVYAAPMRNPTLLLSFLLVCVLLARLAVGVAGWHFDFPLAAHEHQSLHCATPEHHHAAGEQDTASEHRHCCCHTHAGSVAILGGNLALPKTEPTTLIPMFAADPYRNPLTKLLIRPPIA
mgnify:CR=1 FL=1